MLSRGYTSRILARGRWEVKADDWQIQGQPRYMRGRGRGNRERGRRSRRGKRRGRGGRVGGREREREKLLGNDTYTPGWGSGQTDAYSLLYFPHSPYENTCLGGSKPQLGTKEALAQIILSPQSPSQPRSQEAILLVLPGSCLEHPTPHSSYWVSASYPPLGGQPADPRKFWKF